MLTNDEQQVSVGVGVHTKCSERDVLMGRGKRVSEWPGNIFFRQVVNKHRDDYTNAIRNQKVEISHRVIKEIADIGGRFLREVNPSNDDAAESVWVEVEQARAIEKTCQALREKEKPNTTDQSPFLGDEVAEQLLERHRIRDELKRQRQLQQKNNSAGVGSDSNNGSKKRKYDSKKGQLKKKRRVDDDGSNSSSGDGSSSTSSSTSEDKATPGLVKDAKKKPSATGRRNKKQLEAKLANKTVSKKLIFPPAEMLERLRKFKEEHGHTAVPPNWSHDVVLADWCTAQRQLYREVEAGYRLENEGEAKEESKEDGAKEESKEDEADKNTSKDSKQTNNDDTITKEQQEMLDSLRTMHFCWDYDEWHWNHRYQQLTAVDGSSGTPEVKLWLRDQRRQFRYGVLPADRVKKLDDAGVSFL